MDKLPVEIIFMIFERTQSIERQILSKCNRILNKCHVKYIEKYIFPKLFRDLSSKSYNLRKFIKNYENKENDLIFKQVNIGYVLTGIRNKFSFIDEIKNNVLNSSSLYNAIDYIIILGRNITKVEIYTGLRVIYKKHCFSTNILKIKPSDICFLLHSLNEVFNIRVFSDKTNKIYAKYLYFNIFTHRFLMDNRIFINNFIYNKGTLFYNFAYQNGLTGYRYYMHQDELKYRIERNSIETILNEINLIV